MMLTSLRLRDTDRDIIRCRRRQRRNAETTASPSEPLDGAALRRWLNVPAVRARASESRTLQPTWETRNSWRTR
jgi:hypothetical protein